MTRTLARAVAVILAGATSAAAESGIATVYRDTATACGEPYRASAMAVAHPLGKTAAMPCGACLRIAFAGREVDVRVNDNGPHIKNRKIDMTPAVAEKLRFPGLGRVDFRRVTCSGAR